MKPRYFATPAAFRAWFDRHHASAQELLVGFHKRHTTKACMTWPESVNVALCFGWIDGHRRSLGEASYTIRFTPRKPDSVWSSVNVAKMQALLKAGLATPAGRAAFKQRKAHKSGIYGHEQGQVPALKRDEQRQLRADKAAWADWQARPPSYRKVVTWWIVSAKKPETRARRLAILIRDSAAGRTVPPMTWTKKK